MKFIQRLSKFLDFIYNKKIYIYWTPTYYQYIIKSIKQTVFNSLTAHEIVFYPLKKNHLNKN